MKPMLAHKFSTKRVFSTEHEMFPCHAQPKLNGVRALWLGTHLQSRSYGKDEPKAWQPEVLPKVHEAIANLQSALGMVRLDGELYIHGMSLQQINSRCAVTRVVPHNDHAAVVYHIFDVIHSKPFSRRAEWLEHIGLIIKDLQLSNVAVVKTIVCTDLEEFETFHRTNLVAGYEGTIYRDSSAGYGFEQNCTNKENRWTCLLKRKDTLEVDAVIIGVNEGEGQFEGQAGSLELQLPNGVTFAAGSGLFAHQRPIIESLKEALVGTRVVVEFEMYSDSGKPLKPVIKFIDDDRISQP